MRTVVATSATLSLLLLAGCSGVSAGDAQVSGTEAAATPVPAGAPTSAVSPAEFPTFEDLGPAIPRTELIGRWKVEGPGVLPETYANLFQEFALEQPCGALDGVWTASDNGRVALAFGDAQLPGCITAGGRDWTGTVAGQRSWGSKVVLTDSGDEPVVVLTPVNSSPPVGTVEAIAAAKFPKTPAAPDGYLKLDGVAGGWVRDVADADALIGIDGIDVNGDEATSLSSVTGPITLVAFGATNQPRYGSKPTSGACRESESLTILVNADGSWTMGADPPRTRTMEARACEPYTGPKVTGPNPVDSLRRAAGGGVDPKTNELVLLDDKGAVVQRLVPRRDDGILIQRPGIP